MKNLTKEQEQRVEKYIQTTHQAIEQAIRFDMAKFFKTHGAFIGEYKLLCKSDVYSDLDQVEVKPTLSSLGEIFTAFGKDMGRAFNEEILDNKEYEEMDLNVFDRVEDLDTVFSKNYLPLKLMDTKAAINKESETLDESDEYYIVLQNLLNKINTIYDRVHGSSEVMKTVLDLPIKLLHIQQALLEQTINGGQGEKIQELEKDFRVQYELLQSEAVKYHYSLLLNDTLVTDAIYNDKKLCA